MLPNIAPDSYPTFKVEGYRLARYKNNPAENITAIVQLAYLDVNRTMKHINPKQSCQLKEITGSFIKNLLVNPPFNQQDFDRLHDNCCERCISLSSPDGANIHYGQAQKLINMSLKYLYNEYATYINNQNYLNFPNNNIEDFFHLPIDSQIRDSLVLNHSFINPTRLPWSQWGKEHYISFQLQLRKRIKSNFKPLEIDYFLWNRNNVLLHEAIN
jgi:hypothetical protein